MSLSQPPPRTALVFSAGGVFGAYQAGAWAALAPHFQPDLIVGTSIGSLNAWLVASATTPDQLRDIWFNPSLAPQLPFRFPRSWRDGFLDSRPLEHRIRELHHRAHPRIPVGVVAVAWRGLHPRLFTNQEITWRHLAASCAIPVCLRQQRVDGHTYMDGGILDSLNIWAAVQMGATRILVLNCWKVRAPRWLDWPVGWVAAQKRKRSQRDVAQAPPGDLRVEIIEPAGTLGTFRDSLFWNRSNVEAWYQLGFDDASSKKHSLCDMF